MSTTQPDVDMNPPPPAAPAVPAVDQVMEDIWAMPSNTTDAVAYLNAEAALLPDGTVLHNIAALLTSKHYHEFTDASEAYFRSMLEAQEGTKQPSSRVALKPPQAAQFFIRVLKPILMKLNVLRVLSSVALVTDRILVKEDSYYLAKSMGAAVSDDNEDAKLAARVLIAYWKLDCGTDGYAAAAENELDAVTEIVDSKLSLAVETHALLRKAKMKLSAMQNDSSSFYTNANLYASFVNLDSLRKEERERLAKDTIVAALISEDVFSFDELYQSTVANFLKESNDLWILELLGIFREGNLDAFTTFKDKTHAQNFNSIPELQAHSDTLQQKLKLCAFMDLCFKSPKQKLQFSQIAFSCKVQVNEVELLVMSCLAKGLVKGIIDEVHQTVEITWTKPKVLDRERIDVMRHRLVEWAAAADAMLVRLQSSNSFAAELMQNPSAEV